MYHGTLVLEQVQATVWNSCFQTPIQCSTEHVLVCIAVIGRASCVTVFCPNIEETKFPEDAKDYDDHDKDQLPTCLILTYHNWKSQPKRYLGKPFEVYIRRNYTNEITCPVQWLSLYLVAEKRLAGPIFAADD